jgi:(E)-4-hydroxy-3-methylbut-2-enyl-diphosphate synthase
MKKQFITIVVFLMEKPGKTNIVYLGGAGITRRVCIGGNAPVTVQTMWKEGIAPVLSDEAALSLVLARIENLQALGCGILRFAVPDRESADALIKIAAATPMPLVADIHFDYRLALRCLEGNVAKIRINPGNIGERSRVEQVASRCAGKGAAIRIGVNSGSLPSDIAERVRSGALSRAEGLAETAFREAAVFDELGFDQFVVSLKASTSQETVQANRIFAAKSGIPLHIGVTEAGPLIGGLVKSAIALTDLLRENIGNTIRVSLSSEMENEVIAGREILAETGKRSGGVRIVSCPRCGRNGFDVHGFVARWQTRLLSLKKDITVAVMGCPVNGPGEAKHADIGITGSGNSAVIFRHGEIVRRCPLDEADAAFEAELEAL